MSERNKTPKSRVKTWFDGQPKQLAKMVLIAAAKNHEWPTIKYVDISGQDQSKSGHKTLINVNQSDDKKEIEIYYNKEALSKYGYKKPKTLIHKSIKQNLVNTSIQPINNKTHIITCEKQSAANDPSDNVLYFEIGGELMKGYRLKYTFITKKAKEAYVNNLIQNNGVGVNFVNPNVISYNSQYKPRTKTVVIKPPKNNSFSPINLPIPTQKQGRTYDVRIKKQQYDQNGNPIPPRQSPNTPYPFNQNNPNGTFNSYQPVEGERGSLQWEIKKVGANAFFPTTSKHDEFTFDANVAYQHNKNRKKCPALPSPDANSHPLFQMIHGVLKTVLTEEELKKVTYEKKDGRTKIYLPQSAHKDDKGDNLISRNYIGEYSDYINKVIEDTRYATTPCQPKSKKDLIWFAINRIKSDYKSACYYYNKEYHIDSNLADYAKFKRDKLDGGNLLENIVYRDNVNGVYLKKFFGKVDMTKLLCECKSYRGDSKKAHIKFLNEDQVVLNERDNLAQAYIRRAVDDADNSVDYEGHAYFATDSLLFLYKDGIIGEGTLTKGKKSCRGYGKTRPWKESEEAVDVPDEMLKVYENAAQLAALDNIAFPNQNESINRVYLTHAYQYTLFRLNGKNLQDCVELKEKSKAILPKREFNPYLQIGYSSRIPPEKQIRHMTLNEAAVGGKVISQEEMATRLYIFAFTETPLECGLMVEPYDDDLMTTYSSLVNGKITERKTGIDYYISEDRCRAMARLALTKYGKGTPLLLLQRLGQAFKNLRYNNNPTTGNLEAKILKKMTEPYECYKLPTLEIVPQGNNNQQALKPLRLSQSGKVPLIDKNGTAALSIQITHIDKNKKLAWACLKWGTGQRTRFMPIRINTNGGSNRINIRYHDANEVQDINMEQEENIHNIDIHRLTIASEPQPYSPKANGLTILENTRDEDDRVLFTINDCAINQQREDPNEEGSQQALRIYVTKSDDNLYTIRTNKANTGIQCSAEITWDKKRYLPIRIDKGNGDVEELGKVDITSIGNEEKEIGCFLISNNKVTNFEGVDRFPYQEFSEYRWKKIDYNSNHALNDLGCSYSMKF